MGNKHYSDLEWVDFVRGLTPGAVRPPMEAHLSSGCRRCRASVEALGAVATVARGEAEWEVPPFALRRAMAIFSLQQPERVQILPRVLARLVFDSFSEPQPVGVRSQQHVSRHAMYRAGDYFVYLKLESEPGTRQVSLVGQLANPKEGRGSMANVPVLLLSDPDVVARTVSNEFGEFQMSYEPSRRLRLYVPVRGDRRIEVTLSRVGVGKTERLKSKSARRVRIRTAKSRAGGPHSGSGARR